jgi:rhomboid protease GluP
MDPSAKTSHSRPAPPTPGDVLRRIAAASRPWFPSEYAREAGIDRDSLDGPLNELRNAGLVIVVDWVRGRGQGYSLTADGEQAATDPAALARALARERPLLSPRDVPVAHPELSPASLRDRGGLTRFDRGEMARQALLSPPPPVITPALILVNLVWFAAGVVAAWQSGGPIWNYIRGGDTEILMRIGGVYGDALLRDEWWRLVTACFVHAGLLHLLLNLYVLGMVGPLAEAVWGRWRFGVIYAWAGLGGTCLAMALRPETVLVGASGAVLGVLAAVFAWLLLNRDHLPTELVAHWMRNLAIVLLLNVAISFVPRVSWEGHLGGALVGFTTAVLAHLVRPGVLRKRVVVPAALLLGLLPAACITGLTIYKDTSQAWQGLRARALLRQQPLPPDQAQTVFAAVIDSINPNVVQRIYFDSQVWVTIGTEPAGLSERLRKLRNNAEAIIGVTRGPAAAYARTVAEFAAALEAALASPDPAAAWGPVAEKRKLVDRRWAELVGG